MSVKIIAGRAKTGKTTLIYDEIEDEFNKNSKENLILIVPELMTYQAECDIIDRFKASGILNVEILNFKRLESKIFEEVGGLKVQDIDIFGKIMLLRQVFEENKDELQIFGNASKQAGFLREFDELIRELKQNSINSDLLKEALSNIDDELLKRKLSDILLIYSKFIEKTLDRFFDEEDKTELFISLIKDSDFIKNSRIWIDGFESFNWQRLKLIKNLYEHSKSLTITLNIDSSYLNDLVNYDDWEAFKTIYDTYASLNKVIERDIEVLPIKGNKIQTPEIRVIENNMFSINVEEYMKKTDKINIYSSLNPYTETEKAAAKVIALVRDMGYRWKDIKVAVGNMDNYGPNIKKVFTQYQIPYFLDVKRDIMDNPLSKYILSLLDMFIWNFRHDNVFDFLKTGFTSININEVNCLENYALQYGIEGDKWFKEFVVKNTEPIDSDENKYDEEITDSKNESVNKSEVEEYRKLFVTDFEEERKEFKKLTTTSEITRFIFRYLEKHNVYEKIQKTISTFIKNKYYEESSEYSQVWNYAMKIFEQLLLVGENTEITLREYRKMIEAGLNEVKVSLIPPTIDKVEIGDIDRIAVNRSKVLLILGANESNLDSKNSEKGLLLDDERELLLENDIRLTKGASYDSFREKHMLYKAFSCPSEIMSISYALGTTAGGSLQPSLYVDTLKKIFILVKEATDLSGSNQLDFVSNYNGTYDYFVENMRKYIDGYEIDDIWKDVYVWFEKNDNEKFEIINKAFNYKNSMKSLKSDNVKEIYKNNMTMTVSKLESYAECQFKYFMENVLRPRPRLVQKIEFYDLGNIYHSIVENFVNVIKDNIDGLTKDKVDEISQEIIQRVLEKQSDKITALEANNRNKYMKEKINRVMKRTNWTIVRQLQCSEFRPKYTELQIDKIDKNDEKAKNGIYLEPVEIKVESSEIKDILRLRGKIDRVDVFENKSDGKIYINLIDYKSSPKDIDLDDAAEGLQLQLIVYLKALTDNGEKLFGSKPEIGGVFYYYINDPIFKDDNKSKIPEAEIFKKLKLRGFVLRDKNIINYMDKEIGSSSNIIPAGIKKDGELSESTKALTNEGFSNLIDLIYNKCSEMSKSIIEGNIDINPYKKTDGSTPCTYCDYISICQFDKSLGNNYRLIKKIKEDIYYNSSKGGDSKDGLDKRAAANN